MSLKIGNHVNKTKKTMTKSIESMMKETNDLKCPMNTCAIFVIGPHKATDKLNENEYESIVNLGLDIYVHNAYTISPWKGNPYQLNLLKEEIVICDKIGACGLIIHFPVNTLDNVISIIQTIFYESIVKNTTSSKLKIYFEIPAVKKENAIFSNFIVLNQLFNALRNVDPNLDRFGLCIDTAHLWSTDVDLSTYDLMKNWINGLNIPPQNLMVHLNDNVKKLGVCPDNHTNITKGEIWKNYDETNIEQSGLYFLVKHCISLSIPMILERKYDSNLLDEYQLIYKISTL